MVLIFFIQIVNCCHDPAPPHANLALYYSIMFLSIHTMVCCRFTYHWHCVLPLYSYFVSFDPVFVVYPLIVIFPPDIAYTILIVNCFH